MKHCLDINSNIC